GAHSCPGLDHRPVYAESSPHRQRVSPACPPPAFSGRRGRARPLAAPCRRGGNRLKWGIIFLVFKERPMFDRSRTLDQVDAEVWSAVQKENERQEQHIELIAS